MANLKEKFLLELPEDALIVTYTFRIPGWIPIKEVPSGDLFQSKIYFYTLSST